VSAPWSLPGNTAAAHRAPEPAPSWTGAYWAGVAYLAVSAVYTVLRVMW
jgi:hypothetical protein